MQNFKKQSGFTLVEIAIVLVIIGLLLGGILKGQELINSARVRNLADQNSGIQAAYYGFIDRYRQVPGDWAAAQATIGIGQTINIPTTTPPAGNGRIDHTLEEAAAVWEQLAKSGFLGGGFEPASATPTIGDYSTINAPRNAFNGALVLTRNDAFVGVASERLNLHLGPNVPVSIARELDVKVDDGKPETGVLRLSAAANASAATFDTLFTTDATPCTATISGTVEYDIAGDAQNCGQAFLH